VCHLCDLGRGSASRIRTATHAVTHPRVVAVDGCTSSRVCRGAAARRRDEEWRWEDRERILGLSQAIAAVREIVEKYPSLAFFVLLY
jgi:hypothetical protein